MRRLYSILIAVTVGCCLFVSKSFAQGWPAQYGGVMLQGFYWDSFDDTRWSYLESQADELALYFNLVWIPQSGNCDGRSMGYNPKYYFDQNSTFGSEAQLRSMISTFKGKGLGTIADVVINHRQNKSNWFDFPCETYNGQTYEMTSTDIVADDDGGATAAEAKKSGVALSQNKDSGEGWGGMRDLDHASPNVQRCVKAYEQFLLNDLGYTGFRYDVGKGFSASYFGMYNKAANPAFSVGEVWDSNETIKNWINGTKTDGAIQSAAFDFQFKYQMRDAIDQNNWSKLGGSNNLICSANSAYRRYSVTFLENHDTEVRPDGTSNGPLRRDTLAANAYMLSMPGTPCVFLKHWQAYRKEIKLMIEARRLVGINNESNFVTMATKAGYYASQTVGTKGKLLTVVGNKKSEYSVPAGWTLLTSGYHYAMYAKDTDLSGWNAIVERVNNEKFDYKEPETTLPDFVKKQEGVYAYFEAPASWGTNINVWAWVKADGTNAYSGAAWPGTVSKKDITLVGQNNGNNVLLWKYSGTVPVDMIIFNNGSTQTADLKFVNGSYYTVNERYDIKDGIDQIYVSPTPRGVYNLQGQKVGNSLDGLRKGIYIINGKKVASPPALPHREGANF